MIEREYVEVDSDESLTAKQSRVERAVSGWCYTVEVDQEKNRLVVNCPDARDAVEEIMELLNNASIPAYVYE